MLNTFLIVTIVFAILAIETPTLRHAVIYAGIYSLLCSFIYLLYKAPDVAIAEAIIGCTLSTVLYLVAIRKYKVFKVYFCFSSELRKNELANKVRHVLSLFSLSTELDLDFILSKETVSDIITDRSYDLVIEQVENRLLIYGDRTSYHYENIKKWFDESPLDIEYHPLNTQTGDE
jgi:uncharacterized MnhB-related membrane protein